jgi:hypothetical protein
MVARAEGEAGGPKSRGPEAESTNAPAPGLADFLAGTPRLTVRPLTSNLGSWVSAAVCSFTMLIPRIAEIA